MASHVGRGVVALAAAGLTLALAAGCAKPHATIEYVGGDVAEQVGYDSVTYQLARDRKVQIVFFRRTAAPVGVADADFEYVFFELPERPRYGWVRQDQVPAYRWVRQSGRDHLWLGTAGHVEMRFHDTKLRMHFDFRATMEPVRGTPGQPYIFGGALVMDEDTIRTQGLVNRYGEWLASLVNPEPEPPPPTP